MLALGPSFLGMRQLQVGHGQVALLPAPLVSPYAVRVRRVNRNSSLCALYTSIPRGGCLLLTLGRSLLQAGARLFGKGPAPAPRAAPASAAGAGAAPAAKQAAKQTAKQREAELTARVEALARENEALRVALAAYRGCTPEEAVLEGEAADADAPAAGAVAPAGGEGVR